MEIPPHEQRLLADRPDWQDGGWLDSTIPKDAQSLEFEGIGTLGFALHFAHQKEQTNCSSGLSLNYVSFKESQQFGVNHSLNECL